MESIFHGKSQDVSTPIKLEIVETSTTTRITSHVSRDAAKNLEANEFVDLTKEQSDKCFVCDGELMKKKSASMLHARTTTTGTPVLARLGSILSESYIVVVDENDWICQDCLKLLNRLDSIEFEAKTLRTKVFQQIQQTYLSKGKVVNRLPSKYVKGLKNTILHSETK